MEREPPMTAEVQERDDSLAIEEPVSGRQPRAWQRGTVGCYRGETNGLTSYPRRQRIHLPIHRPVRTTSTTRRRSTALGSQVPRSAFGARLGF
jgi:hypothetical protein